MLMLLLIFEINYIGSVTLKCKNQQRSQSTRCIYLKTKSMESLHTGNYNKASLLKKKAKFQNSMLIWNNMKQYLEQNHMLPLIWTSLCEIEIFQLIFIHWINKITAQNISPQIYRTLGFYTYEFYSIVL